MDEQTTEPPEPRPVPEIAVYEQLCRNLYDYRFGSIGFLELLDAFEQILHINAPQANSRSDLDELHQAELMNHDSHLPRGMAVCMCKGKRYFHRCPVVQ